MYLSKLEMLGFKSFAKRTVLDFEPGMTAVVGPNGCGKSNISDAIRWVLGEQSPKAMRGKKMQDCIFEGTEDKQRLGMAEVSLTLSDCEETLGVDYNEVKITRRVFRSGEGEYLINKTRCRLKDVQRLFMDTGVGTNSYSVMEQGRIDYILSARPEDRRVVFEEASGITKFKADKKEALRKLEHTEANLLRLEDIIREVKRQIISLQRQAGKARRYKDLRAEVRGLDIYLARGKIAAMDAALEELAERQRELGAKLETSRKLLSEKELQVNDLRTQVSASEEEIEDAMRAETDARSRLEKNRELIGVNKDRIDELTVLSERDSRDAESAREKLAEHSGSLAGLRDEIAAITGDRDAAREDLDRSIEILRQAEDDVEEHGSRIHNLRSESIDLESRYSALQNEQSDIDARERSTTIRRERMTAEISEIEDAAAELDRRGREIATRVENLEGVVSEQSTQLETLSEERARNGRRREDLKSLIAKAESELAGKSARIELLQESEKQGEGYSGGARRLLKDPGGLDLRDEQVLGPLAEQIVPDEGYADALAVALRTWMDAVVMNNLDSARNAMQALARSGAGSARLLAGDLKPDAKANGSSTAAGTPLSEHLQYPPELSGLVELLLGNVLVVDSLASLPETAADGAVFVTREGELIDPAGICELWMPTDDSNTPLARRQKIGEWQAATEDLRNRIERMRTELEGVETERETSAEKISDARSRLEEERTRLAIARDELKRNIDEKKRGEERRETVGYELQSIAESDSSARERRTEIQKELEQLRGRQTEIRETISELNEKLRASEQHRSRLLAEVTDKRVAFTEKEQRVLGLDARRENLQSRIGELENLIEERAAGVDSYQSRISRLRSELEQAGSSIEPLEKEADACARRLEAARQSRREVNSRLAELSREVDTQRTVIEELQGGLGKANIELTEQRMRRENIVERISDEYNITEEAMLEEPEPEWDGGEPPEQRQIEQRVRGIKDKLEKMGPVNLVAIDEHRELEDRFEFLKQQQEDLNNSREQLLTMIKRINKTTTEMFMKSFNSINENFKELFKEIFGGGNARLELSEEGDILESGIEIIARPPGKKLQTVSLLSGGERTMTAIALLFALYEEKPSAFCLLDELDAALDESNIDRFLRVVQKFLVQSQFVVITHNQKTIAAADCLYGVTMEEQGVSKIVSVKFHGKQLALPVGE